MAQQHDTELLSRIRRIETRLTQLLVASGVDTQAQKPRIVTRTRDVLHMEVPSKHSSIAEIIDALPERFDGRAFVYIGDRHLTTLDCGVRLS